MARKRGRPPTFTRDDLVAAAVRIGPDKLSLQALAVELGVARNSLYWHVRDRSDVGALVLAHLIAQGGHQHWAPDDGASWDQWLAAYARMLRSVLITVGGWIQFMTARLAYTPESLRAMERLLASLVDAGFSIEDAVKAFAFTFEMLFASVRAAVDTPAAVLRDALSGEIETIDTDVLTLVRQAIGIDPPVSADAQFEHDLECTLLGIGARAGIAPGRAG